MNSPKPDDELSVKEAARYLGYAYKTIDRAVSDGKLQVRQHSPGAKRFVRFGDLMEWANGEAER